MYRTIRKNKNHQEINTNGFKKANNHTNGHYKSTNYKTYSHKDYEDLDELSE